MLFGSVLLFSILQSDSSVLVGINLIPIELIISVASNVEDKIYLTSACLILFSLRSLALAGLIGMKLCSFNHSAIIDA